MTIESTEPELVAALQQVVDGMVYPDWHFTVTANYYDHLTPGREGERWYIAHIWFNQEATKHVELLDEGIACTVQMNRADPDQLSRILLPYSQIYRVEQLVEGHTELYYRVDKLNLKRPGDTY
jgi:hypothetical protein